MANEVNQNTDQIIDAKDVLEQSEVTEASSNKTTVSDLPLAPGDKDLLGTKAFRETVIDYIKYSDTPFSLALKGEMGSGKTSLMNYIKDELCDKAGSPYYSVFVNVWQFDLTNQSTPFYTIADILKSIVMQLGEYNQDSQVFKNAKKICGLVARGMAQAGAAKFGISNNVVDKAFELYEKSDYNYESELKHLKDAVNTLVDEIMFRKNGKRGFIFFVDNIACVKPRLAIEILGFIRNIFDIKHCIVIFSFDDDILNRGLESIFGQRDFKNAYQYDHFLDKIFQATICMPVAYYDTRLLIEKAVKVSLFSNNELSDDLLNELNIIVKQTVGENPRYLKILINKLSLLSSLEQNVGKYVQYDCERQMTLEEKKINFLLQCIMIAYPELCAILKVNPCFKKWDIDFANSLFHFTVTPTPQEVIKSITDSMLIASAGFYDEDNYPKLWEVAVFCVCGQSSRLCNNFGKIIRVLRTLDEFLMILNPNGDYEDLVKKLFSCADKNTGVNNSFEELIKARFFE